MQDFGRAEIRSSSPIVASAVDQYDGAGVEWRHPNEIDARGNKIVSENCAAAFAVNGKGLFITIP
jgi:hypothetical protein